MGKTSVTLPEGVIVIPPREEGRYRMPTEAYLGRGAFSLVAPCAMKLGMKNILVVADQHVRGDAELRSAVAVIARTADVAVYDAPFVKSDFATINALTAYCRAHGIDGIIAVGGGTVLDSAKCAAAIAPAGGTIEEYVVSKTSTLARRGLPFIAVPTTAGTGSEVTPFAVVWANKKYALTPPQYLFPDIAIVDPRLTDTLPPAATAAPGIDALCQAIEAYWNVHHNPVSDEYALEAIRSIMESLEAAVNRPTPEARDAMARGSLFGGLAFSNTQTTICHALSYPMSIHWGLSHGQATSMTLPLFLEYFFPFLASDRQHALLGALGAENVAQAADHIRRLMTSCGLMTTLSAAGIPHEGIAVIVAEGIDPNRAGNAPKIPLPGELAELLQRIFS